MGMAEAMLIEYNGRRKNPAGRLAMGKLYAKDNTLFPATSETYGEDPYTYEDTAFHETE